MTTKSKKKVIVFDLDDTLYKEIDFAKSGFREIAGIIAGLSQENEGVIFEELVGYHYNHKNTFKEIIRKHQLIINITELLEIYRTHLPCISLTGDTLNILKKLESEGCVLGLLTDGRSIQQKNKIKALGVEKYFSEIVISEEFGTEKPDKRNYVHFEHSFGEGSYYCVGDNTGKDFITPNKLGWTTICLLDHNEVNIHPQDFELPHEYLPKFKIDKLSELLDFI